MISRFGSSLAAGALALLAPLACSTRREVTIGAVLSLSQEGAYYGQAIRQGMDLAQERINSAGGVDGSPLRILVRDSASSREQAARAAVELYDRFNVPLILGGVLSSETLQIAPLAEQRHKILLSPASSSPEITRAGRYIFRVYPSDTLEGTYMAQLAADELHLQQVAVVAIDNDFGRGISGVFRKNFRGGPPAVFLYPARGANYPRVAEAALQVGTDGLYLVGYYDDMAELLQEIRRRASGIRILGTSSFGNPRTLERAGSSAEGVIFPATMFDPESDDPAVARFVKDFRIRYGVDPDLWAAHGYDAVMVTAAALEKAGGPVPDKIAAALLAIRDFPGASGPLSFDPEGDVVQYPRAYIVHEGKFILYRDYLERMRHPERETRSGDR